MMKLLKSYIVNLIAILISDYFMDSVSIDNINTALVLVLFMSLLHFIAFRIMIIYSACFILLTFGIGIFIIDASLFLIASKYISGLHIDGFWSAIKLSIITILLNSILYSFIKNKNKEVNKK